MCHVMMCVRTSLQLVYVPFTKAESEMLYFTTSKVTGFNVTELCLQMDTTAEVLAHFAKT